MNADPLLSVEGLCIEAGARDKLLSLVSGVDFAIRHGEVVGIVGESGSGKSITALSLMGLLPTPGVRVASGRIRFEGRDMRALNSRQQRQIRGKHIGMIFQDPMSSLNPVMKIGTQLAEAILLHEEVSRRAAWTRAIELLEEVHIPAPAARMHDYPHRLSGGMRQRVMIAMALSCRPKLLIADEPTTALDVTIQAQILRVLRQVQRDRSMAVLLITHDFGVIAEVAQRVLVMYGGRIVEDAAVPDLFSRPLHPYTKGLLRCIPSMAREEGELPVIEGTPPAAGSVIRGCGFWERCPERFEPCSQHVPSLVDMQEGRRVACWLHVAAS